MNDSYTSSKLFRSRRYIRCARISTRLPALITISSTWLPQERFLVKIIPRCLCEVTSFIILFPKCTGAIGSFLFLRETSKVSVLEGQKFTSHRSAHLLIVSKYLFIKSTASDSSSKSMNNVVSSANKRIFELMFSVMSFINTKNRSGPNTDPWGTPAFIWPVQEESLPMTTFCFLLDK